MKAPQVMKEERGMEHGANKHRDQFMSPRENGSL